MEPESSLPLSQVPATCSYPESNQSSPCPSSYFLNIHLNTILPPTPRSAKWPLSLRFPHRHPVYTSHVPLRATCLAHLIILDFITRKMLGEEYRSLSSSLFRFLRSPVTSFLIQNHRTGMYFRRAQNVVHMKQLGKHER
jgi:hypothetical protein